MSATVSCKDCNGSGKITYGVSGRFCDAPTSSETCFLCGGSGIDVDATEEANDPDDLGNEALLQASIALASGGARCFRRTA